jgi:hypothetical protein
MLDKILNVDKTDNKYYAILMQQFRVPPQCTWNLHSSGMSSREVDIWLTTFYVLFSQTVCLKKAKSKRAFFCFSPASGSLHDDICMFHFCLHHKFAITALLCSTQYSDMFTVTWTSNSRTECNGSSANLLCQHPTILRYSTYRVIHLLLCVLFLKISPTTRTEIQLLPCV